MSPRKSLISDSLNSLLSGPAQQRTRIALPFIACPMPECEQTFRGSDGDHYKPSLRIGGELSIGAFLENHISPLPGLIVDQAPFMT